MATPKRAKPRPTYADDPIPLLLKIHHELGVLLYVLVEQRNAAGRIRSYKEEAR
jgi:hypothetical protein